MLVSVVVVFIDLLKDFEVSPSFFLFFRRTFLFTIHVALD